MLLASAAREFLAALLSEDILPARLSPGKKGGAWWPGGGGGMQCQCCNEQSAQLDWIVLDYVHVHCAAWTLHSAICTRVTNSNLLDRLILCLNQQ